MSWEVRVEKCYKGPHGIDVIVFRTEFATKTGALNLHEDYAKLIEIFYTDSEEYPNSVDFYYRLYIEEINT